MRVPESWERRRRVSPPLPTTRPASLAGTPNTRGSGPWPLPGPALSQSLVAAHQPPAAGPRGPCRPASVRRATGLRACEATHPRQAVRCHSARTSVRPTTVSHTDRQTGTGVERLLAFLPQRRKAKSPSAELCHRRCTCCRPNRWGAVAAIYVCISSNMQICIGFQNVFQVANPSRPPLVLPGGCPTPHRQIRVARGGGRTPPRSNLCFWGGRGR